MRKNTAFYKAYTVTDFILDPDFIAWCKNLPDADEAFWLKFMEEYPGQKEALKTASLFLASIHINESSPEAITVRQVWERIEYANRKYATTRTPFIKSTLFRIAAFFIFLFAGAAIYALLNTKHTTTTSYGQIRRIVLPDHSVVVLNARSMLRYSRDFRDRPNREVYLTGEAYFEVSKDKKHPFIVHTPDGTHIEVVGTHFNVKAYDNDKTVQTTVLEGAVKVTRGNTTNLLTPGKKAIVPKIDLPVKILDKVSEPEAIAWKNGQFNFNQTEIHEIMDQLERWYHISVEYKTDISVTLSGTIQQNLSLRDVLKILELTSNLKFTVNGATVTVATK